MMYYEPAECGTELKRPGAECTLRCPGGAGVHGGPSTLTCGEDSQWSSGGQFGTCSTVCEALGHEPLTIVSPSICTEGFVKTGLYLGFVACQSSHTNFLVWLLISLLFCMLSKLCSFISTQILLIIVMKI